MESLPRMSAEEYKELIALNRKRVSGLPEERKTLPKVNSAKSSVEFELEEPPKM
jgi:hypothetical protein